jgi:hypothetical protein
MSGKPIVLYESPRRIEVGLPAIVRPIDHPSDLVSNDMHVLTSPVIVLIDGGFETENTIYRHEESL